MVFDWDGTLVDSEHALVAAGRAATAAVLGAAFPRTGAERIQFLLLPPSEMWQMLSDDPDDVLSIESRFVVEYARSAPLVRPFEGATTVLAALRARSLGIAITTSKSREELELEMAQCGFDGLVDEVVTLEDSASRPPDPAKLALAALRLGVDPASLVVLGDSPHDVVAGRSLGTIAGAASYGSFRRDELERQHPHFVLDRIDGLLGEIDRRRLRHP